MPTTEDCGEDDLRRSEVPGIAKAIFSKPLHKSNVDLERRISNM